MPRRRKGRLLDGILLLDKPAGVTSNAALQRARWLLQARKAGHTGTLDPFATGLLPLCFGQATRFGTGLLEAAKVYRAVASVGARTDTGDSDGEVVEARKVAIPAAPELDAILERFRGEIEQVPPMYSAIKQGGQRLHELARAGQVVERKPRRVRIDELRLEDVAQDTFTIHVRCSSGTYVRTLVEDIADAFGAPAHTSVLRRLGVGPFALDDAVTLDTLEGLAPEARDALLLPVDAGLVDLPLATVDAAGADQFVHGQRPLGDVGGASAGALVRVQGDGRFLGVAEVGPGSRLVPKKVVASTGTS